MKQDGARQSSQPGMSVSREGYLLTWAKRTVQRSAPHGESQTAQTFMHDWDRVQPHDSGGGPFR